MENQKSETHLLAYFDILGYTSFMRNVESQQSAAHVIRILNTINQLVQDTVRTESPEFRDDSIENSLSWIVFSDTIVVSLPYSETNRNKPKVVPKLWHYFLLICCEIQFKLFMQGLPARGCIHVGARQTLFRGSGIG